MGEGLRQEARRLRAELEMSGPEIARRLGVSRTTVREWVQDLPAPDWTKRPNAKDELRAEAEALRRQGLSVPEIAKRLGVARSTAYLWTKHVPWGAERSARRSAQTKAMLEARWGPFRIERDAAHEAALAQAMQEVGHSSDRELLMIGAAIYWCEGAKSKPWRRDWSLQFINSDIVLVRLFQRFLELLDVSPDRLTYRLSIHELADAEGAKRWWDQQLGLEPGTVEKVTLKRHNPVTVRRNTEDDYHGCLVIRVRRSRELYWRVEGIMAGLAKVVGPRSGERR